MIAVETFEGENSKDYFDLDKENNGLSIDCLIDNKLSRSTSDAGSSVFLFVDDLKEVRVNSFTHDKIERWVSGELVSMVSSLKLSKVSKTATICVTFVAKWCEVKEQELLLDVTEVPDDHVCCLDSVTMSEVVDQCHDFTDMAKKSD